MCRKIRVQIIGNYLDELKKLLAENNIIVENTISGCNPLAMVGHDNSEYERFCDGLTHIPTVLNIRKNLKNMISHDANEFQSNILYQNFGEEVRYSNESEWLIISNNIIGYTIYEKNDSVYSDSWPQNDFLKYIQDPKNSFRKMSIPYPCSFNWKFYYDRFIETILKEYPADHIILIKTNSAQWYSDNKTGQIFPFEKQSIQYRNFVEELDEYLLEKINCAYIDNMFSFIPPTKNYCAFTYARSPYEYYVGLADSISKIIHGAEKSRKIYRYFNPIVQKLRNRFSDNVFMDNSKIFEKAEMNWNILDEIIDSIAADEKYRDIVLLKRFLIGSVQKLSDYVLDNIDAVDYNVIFSYIKYMKLDINDIYALYYLYTNNLDKKKISEAVNLLFINSSFNCILTHQKLHEMNLKFLSDYPYINPDINLKSETTDVIILVNTEFGLRISLMSAEPFRLFSFKNVNINFKDVLNNGMICTIHGARSLCRNWGFYIQRAKQGLTNSPVAILFENNQEFIDSLHFINYSKMLNDERFVLALKTSTSENYPDFKNVVNLDFLFEDKVTIGHIRAGLSDQICYYSFGKYLAEKTNSKLYLDDVFCQTANVFNGLEVDRFTLEDISDMLISNHISNALIESMLPDSQLADILYCNGVDDLVAAVPCNGPKLTFINSCPKLMLQGLDISLLIKADFRIVYSTFLIRPDRFCKDLDDYIRMPDFTDQINPMIEVEMRKCDAIAIHVRRGDFVTWGWETDMEFYKESMEKLMKIPDYPNKKFFIFSDDIPWCRENLRELGFEMVENPEITFVDNNKGDQSYRDMQLITNAKVIIGSNSGFVRMAAFVSKKCELFMCYNLAVAEIFRQMGKCSKYDVGPYKKNYSTDYSSKSQKK